MKSLIPFIVLLALAPLVAPAQVGVGTTTPDAKAALDVRATDKGLLIPRLTAAQRTVIAAPPQGLMVYQTDGTPSGGAQTGFWYYAGSPAQWVFLNPTPGGGSFTLPYTGTASVAGSAFAVTNTAFDSEALSGTTTNDDAAGVAGRNTNTTGDQGVGVKGTSRGGTGVSGTSFTSGAGVFGESVSGTGVLGTSNTGVAVQGDKPGFSDARGRVAQFTNASTANDSTAVYISTPGDRPALRAVNTAPSGQAAIRGVKQAAAPDGIGVEGVITAGASGNATGVLGQDRSGGSASSGVLGRTTSGYGVRGEATGSGGYGVQGNATNAFGVVGSSQTGSGVYGLSSAPGSAGAAAVLGRNASGSGVGVRGVVTGGVAVAGENTGNGDGVSGEATTGSGVNGRSSSGSGVYGETAASGSTVAGVRGVSAASAGTGVLGTTVSGAGVRGVATGNSNGSAVAAQASGAATAVNGETTGTGFAGFFANSNAANTSSAVVINNVGSGAALRLSSIGTGPGLVVAGTADVGIGTTTPNSRLSISPGTTEAKITLWDGGSTTAHYGLGVSGFQLNYHVPDATARHVFYAGGKNGAEASSTELLRITGTGEVNAPATGAANLLPVAYGSISATGAVLSGSGNFTVVPDVPGLGIYTITITSLSTVNLTNAVCQVTPRFGKPGNPNQTFAASANGGTNGRIVVHTSDLTIPNNQDEQAFSFVLYRP